MKKISYIFRWTDGGIEVRPPRHDTPEQVWDWAEIFLRGATETAAEGKASVHKFGEVVVEEQS